MTRTCSICYFSHGNLVKCSKCAVYAHMECLPYSRSVNKFTCDACTAGITKKSRKCQLCPNDRNGFFVRSKGFKDGKDGWVHLSCIMYLSGICCMLNDLGQIQADLSRVNLQKGKCFYCSKKGGSQIDCLMCETSCHVPCGAGKGFVCHLIPLQEYLIWTIDEVVTWLGSISMDKYSSTFRRFDIDGRALSELTTNTLRDVMDIREPDVDTLIGQKKVLEDIGQIDSLKRPLRGVWSACSKHKDLPPNAQLFLDKCKEANGKNNKPQRSTSKKNKSKRKAKGKGTTKTKPKTGKNEIQESWKDDGEDVALVPCLNCGTAGDEAKFLLCENPFTECNNGAHTYCLDPPLSEVPDGKWYCPACTKRYYVAVACSKCGHTVYESERQCVTCGGITCNEMVHQKCLDEDFRGRKWFCASCVKDSSSDAPIQLIRTKRKCAVKSKKEKPPIEKPNDEKKEIVDVQEPKEGTSAAKLPEQEETNVVLSKRPRKSKIFIKPSPPASQTLSNQQPPPPPTKPPSPRSNSVTPIPKDSSPPSQKEKPQAKPVEKESSTDVSIQPSPPITTSKTSVSPVSPKAPIKPPAPSSTTEAKVLGLGKKLLSNTSGVRDFKIRIDLLRKCLLKRSDVLFQAVAKHFIEENGDKILQKWLGQCQAFITIANASHDTKPSIEARLADKLVMFIADVFDRMRKLEVAFVPKGKLIECVAYMSRNNRLSSRIKRWAIECLSIWQDKLGLPTQPGTKRKHRLIGSNGLGKRKRIKTKEDKIRKISKEESSRKMTSKDERLQHWKSKEEKKRKLQQVLEEKERSKTINSSLPSKKRRVHCEVSVPTLHFPNVDWKMVVLGQYGTKKSKFEDEFDVRISLEGRGGVNEQKKGHCEPLKPLHVMIRARSSSSLEKAKEAMTKQLWDQKNHVIIPPIIHYPSTMTYPRPPSMNYYNNMMDPAHLQAAMGRGPNPPPPYCYPPDRNQMRAVNHRSPMRTVSLTPPDPRIRPTHIQTPQSIPRTQQPMHNPFLPNQMQTVPMLQHPQHTQFNYPPLHQSIQSPAPTSEQSLEQSVSTRTTSPVDPLKRERMMSSRIPEPPWRDPRTSNVQFTAVHNRPPHMNSREVPTPPTRRRPLQLNGKRAPQAASFPPPHGDAPCYWRRVPWKDETGALAFYFWNKKTKEVSWDAPKIWQIYEPSSDFTEDSDCSFESDPEVIWAWTPPRGSLVKPVANEPRSSGSNSTCVKLESKAEEEQIHISRRTVKVKQETGRMVAPGGGFKESNGAVTAGLQTFTETTRKRIVKTERSKSRRWDGDRQVQDKPSALRFADECLRPQPSNQLALYSLPEKNSHLSRESTHRPIHYSPSESYSPKHPSNVKEEHSKARVQTSNTRTQGKSECGKPKTRNPQSKLNGKDACIRDDTPNSRNLERAHIGDHLPSNKTNLNPEHRLQDETPLSERKKFKKPGQFPLTPHRNDPNFKLKIEELAVLHRELIDLEEAKRRRLSETRGTCA